MALHQAFVVGVAVLLGLSAAIAHGQDDLDDMAELGSLQPDENIFHQEEFYDEKPRGRREGHEAPLLPPYVASDDMYELEHLVTFIHPHKGTCPIFDQVELYFDAEDIMNEYSVEQLEDLQAEYLEHLPLLERQYQALLSTFDAANHHAAAAAPPSADGSDTLKSGGVSSIEVEPDGSVRLVLNLESGLDGEIPALDQLQQLLSDLLHGGNAGASARTMLQSGSILDLRTNPALESLVLDPQSIVREAQRRKYMDMARPDTDPINGAAGDSNSFQGQQRVDEQSRSRLLEDAVEAYDNENAAWMADNLAMRRQAAKSKVEVEATHKDSVAPSKLMGILTTIARVCQTAEPGGTSVSAALLSLASLLTKYDDPLSVDAINEVRDACLQMKEGRTAASDKWRQLWETVHGGKDHSSSRSFVSPFDVLAPVLLEFNDTASDDPFQHIVELVEWIESGDLLVMESAASTVAAAYYAAFLFRWLQSVATHDGSLSATSSVASAAANLHQAVALGSAAAAVALGTMMEHPQLGPVIAAGSAGGSACYQAVEAVLPVALRTQFDVFRGLVAAYRPAKRQFGSDGVEPKAARDHLLSALRFQRPRGLGFSVSWAEHTDVSETSAREVFAVLTERISDSKSTVVAERLLHTLGLHFFGAFELNDDAWEAGDDAVLQRQHVAHCWVWAVVSKQVPHVMLEGGTRTILDGHVRTLCDPAANHQRHSSPEYSDTLASPWQIISNALDEHTRVRRRQGAAFDPIAEVVVRCIDDLEFYASVQQSLTAVAVQMLHLPPFAVEEIDSTAEMVGWSDERLRMVSLILQTAETVSERTLASAKSGIQNHAVALAVSMRISDVTIDLATRRRTIDQLAGMKWHEAMIVDAALGVRNGSGLSECVTSSVELLQAVDAVNPLTAALVHPELLHIRGMVTLLQSRADDDEGLLNAVLQLAQCATFERDLKDEMVDGDGVDEAATEADEDGDSGSSRWWPPSARRQVARDIRATFQDMVAEGTLLHRSGACLYTLSLAFSEFMAPKTATRVMQLWKARIPWSTIVDAPGASVLDVETVEGFHRSLVRAAASEPHFHPSALMEHFALRYSRGPTAVSSEASCLTDLADVRTVMSAAFRTPEQLHRLQQVTDVLVYRILTPRTTTEIVMDALSGWIGRLWDVIVRYLLSMLLFGTNGSDRIVLPPERRESPWVSIIKETEQGSVWTHRSAVMVAWAGVLELSHVIAQEGSLSAVVALLDLPVARLVPPHDRSQPLMLLCELQRHVAMLASRTAHDVIEEEIVRFQLDPSMSAMRRRQAPNTPNIRSPFLHDYGELRIDFAQRALRVHAEHELSRVDAIMNTSREDASMLSWFGLADTPRQANLRSLVDTARINESDVHQYLCNAHVSLQLCSAIPRWARSLNESYVHRNPKLFRFPLIGSPRCLMELAALTEATDKQLWHSCAAALGEEAETPHSNDYDHDGAENVVLLNTMVEQLQHEAVRLGSKRWAFHSVDENDFESTESTGDTDTEESDEKKKGAPSSVHDHLEPNNNAVGREAALDVDTLPNIAPSAPEVVDDDPDDDRLKRDTWDSDALHDRVRGAPLRRRLKSMFPESVLRQADRLPTFMHGRYVYSHHLDVEASWYASLWTKCATSIRMWVGA